MTATTELVLLLAGVGAACAVPGVFLLLRRVAIVSDAISHVLLFGIVSAYLVVQDRTSPFLFFGAAASGVLTVALVELLQRTKLVKEDAAIGLVFPALFALGAVMLTAFVPRTTHLDIDTVLLGNEQYSVGLNRWLVGGTDLGPQGTWLLFALFVLNSLLVLIFYKELKLSTFDPELAAVFGFAPAVLHYGLMTCVSLTAVAAFDAVGPVVVVALFVVPAAGAYLLTDRLSRMLLFAVLFAVGGAVAGTVLAVVIDANVAGTVAVVQGLIFGVVFCTAPRRGLMAQFFHRIDQRRRFHETMLTIHLLQHEGTPQEMAESSLIELHLHLHWLPHEVARVVKRAERNGLVLSDGRRLKLTTQGRAVARLAFPA
ncbi:MAG: metal ABC transporter permease [Fimbriiglobus sp.]|jgi:manganese/zinc/iron transport system permease protein|nr:metal ABC transporter permease [Fimbriiglobus sp.]